jgi:hypothetical protein
MGRVGRVGGRGEERITDDDRGSTAERMYLLDVPRGPVLRLALPESVSPGAHGDDSVGWPDVDDDEYIFL